MKQIKPFNSPNSKEWLGSLLSYFINIKSIDDNIESLRIALCSQNDFTPNQLFQYLDIRHKDFLLLNDFVKFLNEMQIPFEEKYLRKFIHNFDKDNDFSLNFQEFLGLIAPKKSNDLKKKVFSNINNFGVVTRNTKNIFGKLLCEELELVKNCIKTAKYCRGTLGFTCYESFVEIVGNDKYITENHLYNFLQKNNINISNNDMHQLMFRLDADDDGRISFEEYKEIFFPTKEGDVNFKNNNISENDYNFFTISSVQKLKQEIPQNITKHNNIVDFTFGQNQKIISDIDNSSNNNIYINKLDIEDNFKQNNTSSYKLKVKNYNYNYPNDKNNRKEKLTYANKGIYSKNSKVIKSYNKLPLLNDESNNFQESSDLNNANTFSSTFNQISTLKNSHSFISPPKMTRIRHDSSSYQSPKLKHTKSPLHFDYSTYSDEDGDEYFKKRRLRQSAKTDTNRNFRIYKNNDINNIIDINNIKNINNIYSNISNSNNNIINNNIENKNKNITKLCCGCSVYDTLCPCPADANFGNCKCPKKVKSNENLEFSYQKKKLKEKRKNSSNGFNTSLNSQFFKTKSQFNFIYNDENENDINVRKFDESRLHGYKQNKLY